jgi:hypothetical protein|tara:strand:+ start:2358 stop:3740 length:1383 start_codon:yes stop_codon:yes gene_type:complete
VDYSKLSKEQTDMGLAIAKAAEKHGLNPDFVIPLFMGESGLAHIPSKKTDSAGKPIAFGVAQLTPATAARYGVPDYMSPDAEANIDAGVRYLKDLMKNKAIGNDPEKIIIGYNAGAGAPFLKSGNLEDLLPETRAHLLNVSGHSPTGELARPIASTAEGAPTATAEASTDESAPAFTFEPGAKVVPDTSGEKRAPVDNTMVGALAGAGVGSTGILGPKAVEYLAYKIRGAPSGAPMPTTPPPQAAATGTTPGGKWGSKTGYGIGEGSVQEASSKYQRSSGQGLVSKRMAKLYGNALAGEDPNLAQRLIDRAKNAASQIPPPTAPLGRIATALAPVARVLAPAARLAGSTLGGISAANNLGEAYANYQEEGGPNMRNVAQGIAGLGGVVGMAPYLPAQLLGGAMQGAMAVPDIYDYVTDASGTNREQVYPRDEAGAEYVPRIPLRQPRRSANPSIVPAGSQ